MNNLIELSNISKTFYSDKNVKVLMGDVRTMDKTNQKIVLKSKKVFEYDYLVTMDADFSHDRRDIAKLLEKKGINLALKKF